MNQLVKFARFILALVLALGAIGFSATIALADPPDNYDWSYSGSTVFTDLCSFPVTVNYNGSSHEIDFYKKDGTTTYTGHDLVQDTYTANGITLVGDPFTTIYRYKFDGNGNLIAAWQEGRAETIHTPGGGILFITAGRINWTIHDGAVVSVDIGNPGNVAALCAALTP